MAGKSSAPCSLASNRRSWRCEGSAPRDRRYAAKALGSSPSSLLLIVGMGPDRVLRRAPGELVKRLSHELRTGSSETGSLARSAALEHRSDAAVGFELGGASVNLLERRLDAQPFAPLTHVRFAGVPPECQLPIRKSVPFRLPNQRCLGVLQPRHLANLSFGFHELSDVLQEPGIDGR